jgi:hypothetical protein
MEIVRSSSELFNSESLKALKLKCNCQRYVSEEVCITSICIDYICVFICRYKIWYY